jgi:uncharacterized protein involved in exopolysaccharide biosynthesis
LQLAVWGELGALLSQQGWNVADEDSMNVPREERATGLTTREDNLIVDALEGIAKQWKLLVLVPLLFGIALFAVSFLWQPRFEAVAMFAPAEDASSMLPTSLQSLATQFGVAIPSSGYNVYYFSQVVQSRAVLERVARDTVKSNGQSISVTELMDVKEEAPDRRLEKTIKTLQSRMDVRADDQSQVVTLRVVARTPDLAKALGQSVLDALDSVSIATQRIGGSYQRRFAQAQADSARGSLGDAEDRLRQFYQSNRNIASSPTLQVEEARLRRQIQIIQDVYLALVNQAEAAKLQEARNTPSISMVQSPLASTRKVWPRRGVWALFGMIGAFMAGAGFIYILVPAIRSAPQGSALNAWHRRLSL